MPNEAKEEKVEAGPKARVRRIFRVENPPSSQSFVIVLIPKRQVGMDVFEAVCKKSPRPNHAQQYVLEKDFEHYDEALKAYRKREKRGVIKEVALSEEGIVYVPPLQKEYNATKAKLAELALRLKLG